MYCDTAILRQCDSATVRQCDSAILRYCDRDCLPESDILHRTVADMYI
jgi:hypothetical protein